MQWTVLKAVEVSGSSAETLQIDVERLGRDEVCTSSAGELKPRLDGTVADGPLRVRGEGHVAAETSVTAKEEQACLAERYVAPLALEAERNLAKRSCAAKCTFDLNDAGVGGVRVGAPGMAPKAEVPLLRVREPEREVSVCERDRRLFVVEFEIEARAGRFNVRKTRGRAGLFLGSRRSVDVSSVEQDALEVPFAGRGVDKVDARFGEADGRELDPAPPKRANAKGGTNGVGADDRLGAKGGIFIDDEIFEGKAGERQEIQTHLVEVDRPAEARTDAVGNASLIAIDADKGREEDEEKDHPAPRGTNKEGGEGRGCSETEQRLGRRLHPARRLGPFPA